MAEGIDRGPPRSVTPRSNRSSASPLPDRTQAVLDDAAADLAALERARVERERQREMATLSSVVSGTRLTKSADEIKREEEEEAKLVEQLLRGSSEDDSFRTARSLLDPPERPFTTSHLAPDDRRSSMSSRSLFTATAHTTPTRRSPLRATSATSSPPASPTRAPSPSTSAIRFLRGDSTASMLPSEPASPIAESEPSRPRSTPSREQTVEAVTASPFTPKRHMQPTAFVATTGLFGHRSGGGFSSAGPSTDDLTPGRRLTGAPIIAAPASPTPAGIRRPPWVKPYDPTADSETESELDDAARHELTTIGERTERDTWTTDGRHSIARARSQESLRSKTLPAIPDSTSSASSLLGQPPIAAPSPSRAAKASDLIAFFEKGAANKPGSAPMQREGGLRPPPFHPGHTRGVSEPTTILSDSPKAKDAQAAEQPDLGLQSAAKDNAPLPAIPDNPVATHPRKSSLSPIRGVRNVVAAWRGRLASGSHASQDAPLSRQPSNASEKLKDRNVFEDAFFTIRRMSTKRRSRRASASSLVQPNDSVSQVEPMDQPDLDEQSERPELAMRPIQPDPPVSAVAAPTRQQPAELRNIRGRLVSQYTEMSKEPQRIGQCWYLNVHDVDRPYYWIKCDAQLYEDRLVLTWLPDGSRDSRGVITLDLVHCQGESTVPRVAAIG